MKEIPQEFAEDTPVAQIGKQNKCTTESSKFIALHLKL